MTNEEAMRICTDMGVHEGGMENWVMDNAWVKFANIVEAHEREKCAKLCDRFQARDVGMQPAECAGAIRQRSKA
jgi:hypothetical protein